MRATALPGDPPGGRRAVAVWGIGVSVYFVAVIFRTSLGVAGLDAADRFDVNASALSTFSILQLLVYAGMQIPVGLLVDRLGTKRVLGLGVVLFTAGQLGFAFSPSYGMALASRALLGCGDAMTVSYTHLRATDRAARGSRGHGGQPRLHAGAGTAAARGGLDGRVRRQRGGGRRGVRVAAAVPEGPPRGPRARAASAPGRGIRTTSDRRLLAGAGYTARAVGPLHDAVPGDGVPAAVGDAVPGGGTGAVPGDGR